MDVIIVDKDNHHMNVCGTARKIWDYIVQCRNTVSMRAQFILESYEHIKKVQVTGLIDEELRMLIEDISNFLKDD